MEPLKNHIDAAAVGRIADAVGHPDGFIEAATRGLEDLELKGRIAHVADALFGALDAPFPDVAPRLVAASRDLVMWEAWVLCTVVERHGSGHVDAAFAAMHELTSAASCEFAVRPFLRSAPERSLAILRDWTADPDVHVRRLVSEGTRPRLPWGGRLRRFQSDPTETIDLLQRLRHDPAEYVRLSVANHLGDIAKDHPGTANALARQWWSEGDANLRWIVRHGLRGPIKAGDPEALSILGYGAPRVTVRRFTASPDVVAFPGTLRIDLELQADADGPLLIDYAVHHVKANGSRTAKVFKWTTAKLVAGDVLRKTKRHAFKPISTRRYYPGEHLVELRVNGDAAACAAFTLTT